ncbi:MAG: cell division protein ZapA [Thermaerobacter sp.]|nr:cell division protein ZapA [Thermaerobacter sp.]
MGNASKGAGTAGDPIRTTVSIYGEDYQLKGDIPEDVVKALAYHVDNRLRVLHSKNPRINLHRLAVLVAMNTAEELFRLQQEHDQMVATMQKQWRQKRESKDAT